mgnify:CR=1 FL=1
MRTSISKSPIWLRTLNPWQKEMPWGRLVALVAPPVLQVAHLPLDALDKAREGDSHDE